MKFIDFSKVALLSSAFFAANCMAGVLERIPEFGLDVEGGLFTNNDAFTTYGGLGEDSTDRLRNYTRNIKQNHKFSWGAGLAHQTDQEIQFRGAFFTNNHRFRDHLNGGAGANDSVATTRLPLDMERDDSARAHSAVRLNTKIGTLTASKMLDYGNIKFSPRVGVERSKLKYEQITKYIDLSQGGTDRNALVKEQSRIAGIGLTLGSDIAYALHQDWWLNVAGDFSLLSGEVRTKYKTTNDYGRDDYDEKSKDKGEIFQHIKMQAALSKEFNLRHKPLTLDLGYRYDFYPDAIKTIHFLDDSISMPSTTKTSNYSFAGAFMRFGMDFL